MAVSQVLRLHEVRRVSELLGEIHELGQDCQRWRAHAIERMIPMLRAQVGLTVDLDQSRPACIPRPIDPIDLGWTSPDARKTFLDYCADEIARDPGTLALAEAHTHARFVTAHRRQLIDDTTWYQARAVSEMRRSGDVDDFVCSTLVWRPGFLHGFIFYRPWNAEPFDAHQRRLLRYFHVGLLRMYKKGTLEHPVAIKRRELPSRLQQTLDLLLAGLSVKQVAQRMQISAHTATDYNKALHRHFGVSTRAELIRLCLDTTPARGLRMPAALVASGTHRVVGNGKMGSHA